MNLNEIMEFVMTAPLWSTLVVYTTNGSSVVLQKGNDSVSIGSLMLYTKKDKYVTGFFFREEYVQSGSLSIDHMHNRMMQLEAEYEVAAEVLTFLKESADVLATK